MPLLPNGEPRQTEITPASTVGRVLIVDGDVHSAGSLRSRLASAGIEATTPDYGEDTLAAIERSDPQLVVLDWDLPSVVTMSLLRHVQQRAASGRSVRLMAVSTYAGEQQVVESLEQGIDDYVVKPYSMLEITARVRALLRPLGRADERPPVCEFARLLLDVGEVRATVSGRAVSLRATEFRLLEFLVRHPERAFRREQLLRNAWGRGSTADVRAVDVTIQRIRRTLAAHDWGGHIQTVRGVGYRLSSSSAPAIGAGGLVIEM
jgi:two-component system, OmpR family, phosphate regulon response regulator PhoB